MAAWAGPGPSEGVVPTPVREAAEAARGLPLPERMKAVSDPLLGLPYVLDPHGEGAGPDLDPPVRYDAWDCLTFVEEVLALSLSGDPAHAAEVRGALRYDGPLRYPARHHFMELQWIPSAVDEGWLVDATASYGRPVTRLERVVDDATWAAWRGRAKFALDDAELPRGAMALDVLSIDDAVALAPEIRPGTLLLTVRADRAASPIWVSHLGFVLPGDPPTVRHATKMGEGRTRDHGLVWYLEHLRTYDAWPAVGVALLEPVEFGPRLSRLSGPSASGGGVLPLGD